MLECEPLLEWLPPVPKKPALNPSADATEGTNNPRVRTNQEILFTPALLRREEATRVVTPMHGVVA